VLAISFAVAALCQTTHPAVKQVQVPDSTAAIGLAEKALTDIYGKKLVMSERPFNTSLHDGVWHVAGTLYCHDKKGNVITDPCVGGVAIADIRQSDGRVLLTGHTK